MAGQDQFAELFQPDVTRVAKASQGEHCHLIARRIDHIYCSLPAWRYPTIAVQTRLFHNATNSAHLCGSDHAPVVSHIISRAGGKKSQRKTIPKWITETAEYKQALQDMLEHVPLDKVSPFDALRAYKDMLWAASAIAMRSFFHIQAIPT